MKYQLSDGGRAEAGHTREEYDCSVRAVATAYAIDYGTAHAAFAAAGRRARRRTLHTVTSKVVETLGDTRYTWLHPKPTVRRFIEAHATGRYVVTVSGHLFALIDGVVSDMDSRLVRPSRRVMGFVQINQQGATPWPNSP